jgi:hypothetical protein
MEKQECYYCQCRVCEKPCEYKFCPMCKRIKYITVVRCKQFKGTIPKNKIKED